MKRIFAALVMMDMGIVVLILGLIQPSAVGALLGFLQVSVFAFMAAYEIASLANRETDQCS